MRRLLPQFLLTLLPALAAAPDAPALAELFIAPQFSRPKLSPNGEYVAFLARQGDAHGIGVYHFATRKMIFKSDGE